MTKRGTFLALCSVGLLIGLFSLFYATAGSWEGRIGIALLAVGGGLLLQFVATRYGHIKLF